MFCLEAFPRGTSSTCDRSSNLFVGVSQDVFVPGFLGTENI